MSLILRAAPRIIHGTPEQRFNAIVGVAATFVAAAFFVSVITPWVDALVPADLSGPLPAIAGGLLAAVVASLKAV